MSVSQHQSPPPSAEGTIRIAIADDHPLLRLALTDDLSRKPGVHVVGAAADSTALLELLKTQPVDVIISDYAMPGGKHGDGLTLFELLRQYFPQAGLIALTSINHAETLQALLTLGVHSVVNKADALKHLMDAVHAALAGQQYLSPHVTPLVSRQDGEGRALSPRELEVLRLFVSGLTVIEIAQHLGRSKQTISSQKNSAMRKLGLHTNAELFRYGAEHHLAVQGYSPGDT